MQGELCGQKSEGRKRKGGCRFAEQKEKVMPGSLLERRKGGVTPERLSNRYPPSDANVIPIEAAMYEYSNADMSGDCAKQREGY